MQNLPIVEVLPSVKQELLRSNRLVLQAPPGAGKTTALPLSLLNEPWLKNKKIMMLEPRRLAVRSSASRMAELLGEKVGQTIGYQIKRESVQGKNTKILIVTEGILTRKLQADPSLQEYALIIFDEFHERSIHADLSLALCLESQSLLREELKILVMSATLNTSAISQLLDNAPIIQSEGRAFFVEELYLDKQITLPKKKELASFIYALLQKVLQEEKGNILVFLPGVREIKELEKRLKEAKIKDVFISCLYADLSKEEQDRAIQAPSQGKRKIVISTNIAQTSLTIEGITLVINSGLQNSSVFNASSGMNRLQTDFISQDAAIQRAGRAGRLSEGKCYHLWHKGKLLHKHEKAEILSADLSALFLELSLWGTDDINDFSWMDLPPATAISHAKSLLFQLGALDKRFKITTHGKEMVSFGLHPRLAHMMIKAKKLKLSYEASLLCVLMTEKDIYTREYRSIDLKERVSLLHDVKEGVNINASFVNIKQCKLLLKMASYLEKKQKSRLNLEDLGLLLAFAYPDRIAQKRQNSAGTYLLSNAKGAYLHKEEELFNSPYLVVSDLDAKSTNALIYKAISLTQEQIEKSLQALVLEQQSLSWNSEFLRVESRVLSTIGAIVLKERQATKVSSDAISEVLIDAIKELGLEVLSWNKEALSLRERVNFVNAHTSLEGELSFPDFSDAYLLKTLSQWLAPYAEGKSSLKSMQSLNLFTVLSSLLTWEQSQELESLAPTKLKVASGSNIYIDYSDIKRPVLAVRLQEMFGTLTTPTVLNGKVKLMIHLLSPARRPMQVTQDLENFWNTTYIEVKKELRGKYKRHYWPDDPLTAMATSKTKKNM